MTSTKRKRRKRSITIIHHLSFFSLVGLQGSVRFTFISLELQSYNILTHLHVVSRTATAPFDRLKVFLITRAPDMGHISATSPSDAGKAASQGMKALLSATRAIYVEGGIFGFWVGNGLNVAKIFPESAIKFFSYESSVLCNSPCFR